MMPFSCRGSMGASLLYLYLLWPCEVGESRVDRKIFAVIFMAMRSTAKRKPFKAKMGRPPKPVEERRTRIIKVLASEAEYEAMVGAARAAGRDLSAWLRCIGLLESLRVRG
jgi:hypothetical protein